MSFTNYDLIQQASNIFYDGWRVVFDPDFGLKGITYCKEKLIILGVWDEWLWAHELTHIFMDCGI